MAGWSAMFDPCQITGCLLFVVMGIVFHVLHQMPFRMPVRRRIDRLLRKIAWMFPRSGEPPRHGFFFFLFSIPFGLFAVGVEMTSRYVIVQWMFALTTVTSAITAYVFFVILTPFARKFWTAVIAVVVGLGLLYLYRYLCPTITIRPTKAVFGSISKTTDLSQAHRFRIQNKTDSDIYSITFYLRVESPSLAIKDFKFDVPKTSQQPADESTALGRKFGDIGGVDCTDSKNRPVFVRVITHLAPGESREVTLTRINSYAESVPPSVTLPSHIAAPDNSSGVYVSAVVSNFLDDSEYSLNRPGFQTDGWLKVDETMKCGQMSYILLSDAPEASAPSPALPEIAEAVAKRVPSQHDKEIQSPTAQHRTLRDSMSVVIPFAVYSDKTAGVPMVDPSSDTAGPHISTYKDLEALGALGSPVSSQAPSEQEMADFLSKMLQYYSIRLLADLGNPTTFLRFNGDRGISSEKEMAITVPDDAGYSDTELDHLLTSNGFYSLDKMKWRFHKLHMPAGTVITLGELPVLTEWWNPHIPPRTVKFERANDYQLIIGVTPKGKSIGLFPGDFKPMPKDSPFRRIATKYIFEFTVSMDFNWRNDMVNSADYDKWTKELIMGFRKHLCTSSGLSP
jgi:hypothetical protein